MLDDAADNITFRAGDDMCDTVARVDDSLSKRAVDDSVRRPRSGRREHGLHGEVQSLDVERLEEDLGGLLSVLWCIEGWFGLSYKRRAANNR